MLGILKMLLNCTVKSPVLSIFIIFAVKLLDTWSGEITLAFYLYVSIIGGCV
jgi:hypothetical protein